ncbi:MAG: branched-chain amino acid ABC transporter permease [Bdellovibrionota bacterium]
MSRSQTFLGKHSYWAILIVALLLPLLDLVLPRELSFADSLQQIFIFAILGLGLNVVTGYTGMLHLGATGFMAIGAYAYAILTCDIYPFQLGFFSAAGLALLIGAFAGVILGLPIMRLTGDYLAIVTLGFGEIVQSLLRNVETVTKGTQGINPLPPPNVFGYEFDPAFYQPRYYLFLLILFLVVLLVRNLEHSRVGRTWIAIREDELAGKCMAIPVSRSRLLALAVGSAICSLAGALYAAYLGSSGEPGNYDFQISITALCIVIVGGMGSIRGVLLGALLMVGFNSIFLVKLSELLMRRGLIQSGSVFFSPSNWKFFIFGMALVLVMRLKPDGLFGERELETDA